MTSIGNSEPAYFGKHLSEVIVTRAAKPKEKASIFPDKYSFSGDKNGNGYVDLSDLNDDEKKLFEEKGIIGKSWDYVKEHFGKLFNIKSATVNITNYKNEAGNNEEYKLELDENGNLSSMEYTLDNPYYDEKVIEKRHNYTYDSNGNITSFICEKTTPADPNLPIPSKTRTLNISIDNVYNNKNELIETYTTSGILVNQKVYDYKNNTVTEKIGMYDQDTGKFRPTNPDAAGRIKNIEQKEIE